MIATSKGTDTQGATALAGETVVRAEGLTKVFGDV
jgi:hypothetical protein